MAEPTWQPIGSVMAPATEPTPRERQAIADVHECAARWAAGTITVAEIRAATSPRQRWLATRYTAPIDPVFAPLMAMLDALIDATSAVRTSAGIFPATVLNDARVRVESHDGYELLCFPVRHPFSVKPDENGQGGVRGEPVYRRPDERKPTESAFQVVARRDVEHREPEWWEET